MALTKPFSDAWDRERLQTVMKDLLRNYLKLDYGDGYTAL